MPGASNCVEICLVEVYELLDGIVSASNIGECIDCITCQDICPYEATLNHSAWQ